MLKEKAVADLINVKDFATMGRKLGRTFVAKNETFPPHQHLLVATGIRSRVFGYGSASDRPV